MTQLMIDEQFFKDLEKLKKENTKFGQKIWDLVASIRENFQTPLEGIGQAEKLKNFDGVFSRRIDKKHRLTYKIIQNTIILLSCYGHYDDK